MCLYPNPVYTPNPTIDHPIPGVAEFLAGLGFGSIQRALLAKAGQDTEIQASETGDAVKIVTTDLRGSSSLELPVNGRGVEADDGDGGARVTRSATYDRGAVIVTERLQGEREPLSVCKRRIGSDGRMVVDVRKRTPEVRDGHTAARRSAARRLSRPLLPTSDPSRRHPPRATSTVERRATRPQGKNWVEMQVIAAKRQDP